MGEPVPHDQPISAIRPWLRASLVSLLAGHAWPGNVRELRNVVRQLLIIASDARPREVLRRAQQLLEAGATHSEDSTPSSIDLHQQAVDEPAHTTSNPQRRFRPASEIGEDELLAALREHRWLFQPTARALGISRTALYRLIDKTPRVRKPSQLTYDEIVSSLAADEGDLEKTADTLNVSVKGLRQRMRQLGLE